MSLASLTSKDAHNRIKKRRLIGWILIYLLLIILFVFAVLWQARRVDTLNFANGTIQLATSKIKYTVGDKISFTIKNGLSEPITFLNSCPSEPFYTYSWTKI